MENYSFQLTSTILICISMPNKSVLKEKKKKKRNKQGPQVIEGVMTNKLKWESPSPAMGV